MKKLSLISLLLGLTLLTSGCGKETDADKIADAQSCLDRATANEAAECVSKVDGIESEAAYLIRCAGKFVKEGYSNPSKLANAFSNIAGSESSGAADSLSVMAALAFSAEATPALNSTSAQEAFGYCEKANSKGMIMLAGFVQTATVLAGIQNIDPSTLTGAQLQSFMATLATDPVAQAAVGAAVVGIYESNCSNGDDSVPGSYCQQFSSAVSTVSGGTSNPAAIGQAIMTCYSTTPPPASCTGF
jgi:hypothetical protein